MNPFDEKLSRREALARAAYLLGGAISAPTLAGVLAGCEAPRKASVGAGAEAWVPRTLSAEQSEMVLTMGEHILPETDTPGARAARVNEYIDAMLTDFYPAERRQHFLSGLERVDASAQRLFGAPFSELPAEQQLELVRRLNQVTFRERAGPVEAAPKAVLQEGEGDEAAGSENQRSPSVAGPLSPDDEWDPADVGPRSFFATLKELVLVGYYTSEVGSTRELRVNPMGIWRADVPYSEFGQAWA